MAKQLGTTGEFFRRRDEWRKHPMLSSQMRHAVPGLGLGVAAFVVYCIGEFAINKLRFNCWLLYLMPDKYDGNANS
ncbi:NADH dehydrogenase [ubiquinone] 1 beta subcomplex subunit 3 [Dillenia turbinata]|uniref:NADH dehydrogenase [ubiquinone] 1 beta subcomplex subunit 3 n=1 Tax=Dillenia turbinata TaxID=194707 RepID=A0AAN8WGQ6_9MAGN